jgi:hypothetical protein
MLRRLLTLLPSLSLLSTSALCPALARAAVGPETTLLAINGASPASWAVGNAWRELRGIPFEHVVVLTSVPPGTHCSRSAFVSGVLDPLRAAVRERGLAGDVALIAFAPDFPLAINMELKGMPPEIGTHGSLTGMTTLGSLVLAGNGEWVSPRSNPTYQRPPNLIDQPPIPRSALPELKLVSECLKAKDYATACSKLQALTTLIPHHASLLYDLACTQAQLGQSDTALATLGQAADAGFMDGKWMAKDDDLKSLHARPAFAALVARLQALKIEPPTTVALGASPRWLSEAVPTADDHKVLPAMLLGVTSGDGLSITATIANLTRAVGADSTHPSSTVYCARNGDVRSTTREWAFEPLVAALPPLGVAAAVVDGVLPQHAPAVAGAVVGSAGFTWSDAHSTIVPGAICEHLTSFGGQVWPGAGQTHLTEWLRAGAAGTSGTVDEPYALQAKFPSPFIHLHYARGVSLIEAFHLAVASPYQLLRVGEPLCAPWARPVALETTDDTHAPRGAEVSAVEVWVDGHRRATVAPGAELPRWQDLAPGEHDLRFVGLPLNAARQPARVNRALTRGTSWQPSLPTTVALDGTLSLHLALPAAATLQVRGVAGMLAEAAGPEATLSCPAAGLGLGSAPLRLIALDATGAIIAQAQRTITVTPPRRLAALAAPAATQPGPVVTIAGSNVTPKTACEGDAWLADTGLRDHGGEVSAWFQLHADGLWQAQWLGSRVRTIAIDDQPAETVPADSWLLRDLAAGWHRVTFTITPGPGACGLRMGSDGTWPLAAANCVHATGDARP